MTTDGVDHAENGARDRTVIEAQRRRNGSARSTNRTSKRTMMLAADHGVCPEGE